MNLIRKYQFPKTLSLGSSTKFLLLLDSLRVDSREVELREHEGQVVAPSGLAMLAFLKDASAESKIRLSMSRKLQVPSVIADSKITTFPDLQLYTYQNDSAFLIGRSTFDPFIGERLEQLFSTVLTEEELFAVQLLMNELMQNAQDHSGSERFFVYAGLSEDTFEFGCFDSGISIPAKLEQKYGLKDDVEAIEKALQKGTSTRRMRSGGLGLWHCFDHLKDMQGSLIILSRFGSLRRYFKNKKISRKILKVPLRGTWVGLSFKMERQ